MSKKILFILILLIFLSGCGSKHEHLFYDTYESNEYEHWRESRCQHEVKTDVGAHNFVEWIITLEPTEETKGTKERKCIVCDWKEIEYIDELEHIHALDEVVIDPSCQEEGLLGQGKEPFVVFLDFICGIFHVQFYNFDFQGTGFFF